MTYKDQIKFRFRDLDNGDAVFEVANGNGEHSWYLRASDIDRLREALGYEV